MRLEINLQLHADDATRTTVAITEEDAKLELGDFIKLVQPALSLIHHNMQAYLRFCEVGAISPKPNITQIRRNSEGVS